MITVLIADDQPLQRLGFGMLLDSSPEATILGEAEHGAGPLGYRHDGSMVLQLAREGTGGRAVAALRRSLRWRRRAGDAGSVPGKCRRGVAGGGGTEGCDWVAARARRDELATGRVVTSV